MIRERLRDLFKTYDPDIQEIIWKIGEFEQMNISLEKPHFKESYDDIITFIARRKMKQDVSDAFKGWKE